MNKKIAIIIGVIILIVIAVAAVMMMKKPSSNTNQVSGESNDRMMAPQTSDKSLKELMTSNQPQECTFTQVTENGTTSGTVFMARGMMRGDFSSQASGQTFASHMVMKDGDFYTWVDGMGTGFKLSASAQAETDANRKTQQQFDVDQKLAYNCRAWSTDESKFEIPTGIQFNSMDAMIQGGTGMNVEAEGAANREGSDQKAAQCAICDQAGSAREQCRQALGC